VYLVISLFVLVLSYLLFKQVAGSLKLTQLNMVSWIFYFQLIIQSFIASILVVNGWDNHYVIKTVSKEARFYGWLAVQYTMIALPVGMLLVNFFYGYKSNCKLFNTYINSPLKPSVSSKDSFIRVFLYMLSFISILAVMYTYAYLDKIPLLAVFQGYDANSLAHLRQEASRGFEGNYYIRNILGVSFSPILTYISYAYWKMTNSKKDFIWFIIMFISSFLILTYDLEKSPFIMFILGFLFLKVLIEGKIKKKTLFIFSSFSMALILLAYVYIAKITDFRLLFSYNSGIVGRILLSQSAGTYMSFEHFPKTYNFIGFASISKMLSQLFGINYVDRAARIMMAIFNPARVQAGTAGVMNSLFIAEAWANFGWIGVIFSPIYVGMFVQIIFMTFLKAKKTPISTGLFAYLSYKLPITGGFNDFLYNPGLVIILVIFTSVYVMALGLKEAKRRG